MANPYWHPQYKPHDVDLGEVRRLCFEIYNLVQASAAIAGDGIEPDDEDDPHLVSSLEQLHFQMAEHELSKKLLHLAVLVRTHDDQMCFSEDKISDAYQRFRNQLDAEIGAYGAAHAGPPDQLETLRRCCNKIIHANDVRPVYTTEDDRDDPNARWGMTSEIELEGTQGGEAWHVSLHLLSFLEGVVDLMANEDAAEAPLE